VSLVDASHTPDQLPSEPRDSEAGSAKIPLRARISIWRQRIIIFLRFLLRPIYRLPIDDLKEQNQDAFNQQALDTIRTLARVSNQMQARLQWYETHIPRMRELKREFDQEQARLKTETNGDPADLANGILAPKRSSLIALS
jgi:hypothetical protein